MFTEGKLPEVVRMDVMYLGGHSVQTGVPPGGREHKLHHRAWGRACDGPCPGRHGPHASRGATEGLVRCSLAAAFLSFPYMFSKVPSVLLGPPPLHEGHTRPQPHGLTSLSILWYCFGQNSPSCLLSNVFVSFLFRAVSVIVLELSRQKMGVCMGGCCSWARALLPWK